MDMLNWLNTAAAKQKPMPILSFPGIQLAGITVNELVQNSKLQAKCMKAVADRWDTLASVSLMDLSVEAEAFGSPIRFSDVEVPVVTAPIVSNEKDLVALKVPAVGDARTGVYVDAISEAKKLITDRPVFASTIGPFSLTCRLMDMTEAMILCYDDPKLLHGVLGKATEFLISYNTALRDAGADGIVMAEPASGLLSPALIAEFSTPYAKRIIETVENSNCVFIYHNCGGSTLTLTKEILDTNAKMLSFGNAIDLHAMLGLISQDRIVMGNVDPSSEFRNGTTDSIRKATLALLEKCAKYSNFILSSGCDIPPVSPLENIDAFFNTAREFYSLNP
jgi:uroporphyrinogen decarboxylase